MPTSFRDPSRSARSSSRLGPVSNEKFVTPVRLPPGRLRLSTSPNETGSTPYIKDNGNGCRRGFRSSDSRAPDSRDHAHAALHQLSRELRETLVAVFGPAVFDRHVAALHIAALRETLMEGAQSEILRGAGCR